MTRGVRYNESSEDEVDSLLDFGELVIMFTGLAPFPFVIIICRLLFLLGFAEGLYEETIVAH